MDAQEKDTVIILGCCILAVLLAIFFLSERRKHTFTHRDRTAEGTQDIYELSVKQFAVGGADAADPARRRLVQSRVLTITRVLLDVGVDLRGEMLVDVNAPPAGDQAGFSKRAVRPVDLNTQFLPEGCCNLNFFDSDLVNLRGKQIRRSDSWDYVRNLSFFGVNEAGRTVHYTFREKAKGGSGPGDSGAAIVAFAVDDKAWVEGGNLNVVEGLQGTMVFDEEQGKLHRLDYAFRRDNEREHFLFEVNLLLTQTRRLSDTELARLRGGADARGRGVEGDTAALALAPKDAPPMLVTGSREQLMARLQSGNAPPGPVFSVRVRTFDDKADAARFAKMLKDMYGDAFILKNGPWFQVCVGRYPAGNERLAALEATLRSRFGNCSICQVP
ncbi:MAG: SPOR domain-containing protein [Planctomycetota bacterium]